MLHSGQGEVATYENLTFTVIEAEGKKITRLVVRKDEAPKEGVEQASSTEITDLGTDSSG